MVETITKETKKERPKDTHVVPLIVGSYVTHNPSNVTCIQIIRSNSHERSRRSITTNIIFLFIVKTLYTQKKSCTAEMVIFLKYKLGLGFCEIECVSNELGLGF